MWPKLSSNQVLWLGIHVFLCIYYMYYMPKPLSRLFKNYRDLGGLISSIESLETNKI